MTDHQAAAGAEPAGRKILFLHLQPGVTGLNLSVFLYACVTTIGLLTFVSPGTALVLNVNFGLPISEQGTVTGDLVIVTEIVQLLIFGVVGVLADKIGRRELFALGILIMGVGYLLYPFAESVSELVVYRAIYALGLGASTGMLGTILADYPQDKSRGKLVAIGGFFNGIGVLLVTVVFGRLAPPALIEAGFDAVQTTRIVHFIVFGACALSALIYMLGLKKGTPADKEERLPFKQLMVSGYTEARNNLRIALAYAGGFVARSDQVVLGTFTVLWGTVAGISQGLDPAIAAARGAGLFGIAAGASLIWLIPLGAFMDRFNRISGVIFCMGVAATAYISMLLVDDPLAPESIKYFALLGAGQISAFFGATTLISQEAPRLSRGSVVGAFNTCGAIGIFVASGLGGRLFDAVGPEAPFVFIGALTLFVFLFAIVVRIKAPGHIPGRKAATGTEAS